MTREDAANILEYPVYKWSMDWDEREDGLSYTEAIETAISALRQQETVTDRNKLNEPLTLEELREMDGEPVWIEDLFDKSKSCWRICYWDKGKYLALIGRYLIAYLVDDYGFLWLSYRQKPAEEDDHA